MRSEHKRSPVDRVATRTHLAALDGEVVWETPVIRVAMTLTLEKWGEIELSREYVP